MDTILKWKDTDGTYKPFDNSEINHQSRDHAIALFSNGIPVIASENGTFITNSADLAATYRAKGKPIVMFKDLQPSEKTFADVGFLGVI